MPLTPQIRGFDHIVLTVKSITATLDFYMALGMEHTQSGIRHELHFGNAKINLHSYPAQFLPAATKPTAGSADICLVCASPMADIIACVNAHKFPIEEGPVTRHGACGEMESLYLRDPDGNLIELSVYPHN